MANPGYSIRDRQSGERLGSDFNDQLAGEAALKRKKVDAQLWWHNDAGVTKLCLARKIDGKFERTVVGQHVLDKEKETKAAT